MEPLWHQFPGELGKDGFRWHRPVQLCSQSTDSTVWGPGCTSRPLCGSAHHQLNRRRHPALRSSLLRWYWCSGNYIRLRSVSRRAWGRYDCSSSTLHMKKSSNMIKPQGQSKTPGEWYPPAWGSLQSAGQGEHLEGVGKLHWEKAKPNKWWEKYISHSK